VATISLTWAEPAAKMPRLISSQRLKSRLSGEKVGEPGRELAEPALRDLKHLHGPTLAPKSTTQAGCG
jgi:hypothetical protein